MAEDALRAANPATGAETPTGRLDSWKEIGAYLKRDVTTVRRWEKREGLPVHRHVHERRDTVYAYTTEIDEWWRSRRSQLSRNGSPNGSDHAVEGDPSAVARSDRRRPARLSWPVASLLLAAALVLAVLVAVRYTRRFPAQEAELRFSIPPPAQTSFDTIALSPDGRQIAFTAVGQGGKSLLWIRPLDSVEPRPLPETDDASFPFWSPASDALGFFASGKLWTVHISGESPHALCDAPNGRGGTWSRTGIIVFAPGREGGLFQVSAAGGAAMPVTTVSRPNQRGHLWPEFLPDGKRFLYLADSDVPEHHDLFVGALDGGGQTLVVPRASSNAVYTANQYLLFARDRQLIAQPFDVRRLAVTGDPLTVVERVQQSMAYDHKTDFSVAPNGVLAYRSMQSPATRLVWRDRTARLSALVDTPAEYTEPTLSPDQSRVAVALFDPRPSKRFGYGVDGVRSDVWIVERSTGAASQFTSDPAADWGPVWSPDGRTIVFSSNRSGRLELYQKPANGREGDESLLASSGKNPVAQSWSPDGKLLVYSAFDPERHMDLWVLPIEGEGVPVPLLHTEFAEDQAQISPDGRWFAYSSSASGRQEVYVQRFPTPGQRWQISTEGGGDPRWSADGKELFYIAEDRRLMVAAVKTTASFEHAAPLPLFDTRVPPQWYAARNLYDVTRDGRFLFMSPVDDDRSMPYTVVVNWVAGLPE